MAHRKKQSILTAFVLLLFFFSLPDRAQAWTFSVISDIRAEFQSFRTVLEEIRDRGDLWPQESSEVDFVLLGGDLRPAKENYEIFREIFPGKTPLFVPVRGNHEKKADLRYIKAVMLPALGENIRFLEQGGITYTFDWKNVRIIVIDQYVGFRKSLQDARLLKWVEESILSASHANHVFVAFHEPLIPWDPQEDPLWSLLLRHSAKVRAVFVGHIHIYGRRVMRGEQGAVQLINSGNAGQTSHSDGRLTIVNAFVDPQNVSYRVLQAPHGATRFKIRDQWLWTGSQMISHNPSSIGLPINLHIRALP